MRMRRSTPTRRTCSLAAAPLMAQTPPRGGLIFASEYAVVGEGTAIAQSCVCPHRRRRHCCHRCCCCWSASPAWLLACTAPTLLLTTLCVFISPISADGGGQGNVIGAVAEAAFMLGMERNSWAGAGDAPSALPWRAVSRCLSAAGSRSYCWCCSARRPCCCQKALRALRPSPFPPLRGLAGGTAGGDGAVLADAYAPLFVNANRPTWYPDMIVFDSSRWVGALACVQRPPPLLGRPLPKKGLLSWRPHDAGDGSTAAAAPFLLCSSLHAAGLAFPATTCSACCRNTWAPHTCTQRWPTPLPVPAAALVLAPALAPLLAAAAAATKATPVTRRSRRVLRASQRRATRCGVGAGGTGSRGCGRGAAVAARFCECSGTPKRRCHTGACVPPRTTLSEGRLLTPWPLQRPVAQQCSMHLDIRSPAGEGHSSLFYTAALLAQI